MCDQAEPVTTKHVLAEYIVKMRNRELIGKWGKPLGDRTIAKYVSCLKDLEQYIKDEKITSLSVEDYNSFFERKINRSPKGSSAFNEHRSAIKLFLMYAEKEGHIASAEEFDQGFLDREKPHNIYLRKTIRTLSRIMKGWVDEPSQEDDKYRRQVIYHYIRFMSEAHAIREEVGTKLKWKQYDGVNLRSVGSQPYKLSVEAREVLDTWKHMTQFGEAGDLIFCIEKGICHNFSDETKKMTSDLKINIQKYLNSANYNEVSIHNNRDIWNAVVELFWAAAHPIDKRLR